MTNGMTYNLPGRLLLNRSGPSVADPGVADMDDRYSHALVEQVEGIFADSGIKGKSLQVITGPVVTTIEYKPDPGTKLNTIAGLTGKLALALEVKALRMVIPIPGKHAIGIEIPNQTPTPIGFSQIPVSGAEKGPAFFLPDICMGLDTAGTPVSSSLNEISHLFIAGEDADEIQMWVNVFLSNILFGAPPDEVRMLVMDPENRGLHVFNDIPHLISPVITGVSPAVSALTWAVTEMEKRNELFKRSGAKSITEYNRTAGNQSGKLAHLIIVVNELAGMMTEAARETEMSVARLAQAAAGCGILLVAATQHPSTSVLPGLFKALFPTRISFKMSSKTNSWIVLDSSEAQVLTGDGDMLVWSANTIGLNRIHGAHIAESELKQLIEFWRKQKGIPLDNICHSVQEIASINPANKSTKYQQNMI